MDLFKVYPLWDIDIVRAEGSYVWDDKGTRYLDMYGGNAGRRMSSDAPCREYLKPRVPVARHKQKISQG